MDLRWSLNELYTSFDSEQFKNDLNTIDNQIRSYSDWVLKITENQTDAVNKLEEYIKLNISFTNLLNKLESFCQLTLSVDTKNENALHNIEAVESKLTALAEPTSKIMKWIGSLDNLNKVINSSALLKDHEFHILHIKEFSKYQLSEKEEVIIAKMKNTGSNAWAKLKDLLVSNLLVEIQLQGEAKKLPLAIIRNMAYEKNAAVRKAAYDAELKSYEKIQDGVAAALNGIKGETITISKMRGYSSVLEQTLINSRMDRKALDAMLSAMEEYLPKFREFYRRKAEILGHKNGLPFYDLFAPLGEVNMKYSYEEAKDFIVNNFSSFSDELADYADTAFKKRWIDAEPREGKVGGAFCSNLHPIGESRILSNFSGSFSDVVTLAHELGHGYHGYCLRNETILNSDYPMPIAETASTFCETIVKKAAIKNSGKNEAFAILESEISDCGQIIVDIYSRFLFESKLIKRREYNSLTSEELKEIMVSAQKQAYGDGLDEQYLHPYMWLCKPHYYFSEANFYNFPYAFGLLFSKGLYAEYMNTGKGFTEKYNYLLSITGKNKLSDIAKLVGIDIHSTDFWKSSLRIIESDINEFLELSR